MTAPLSPQEFRAVLDPLLAPLGRQGKGALAVAVSGGGDSMALLLLAHAAYPGRVAALTVDHGLRTGSADEARQVGAWCAARGIAHRVLTWKGPKPSTGIQAVARAARYQLLAHAAIELGTFPPPFTGEVRRSRGGGEPGDPPSVAARHLARACGRKGTSLAAPLLVAQTIEDQAETFALRLAHKSDLAGLRAMRPASEIAGAPPVPLLRPLLDVTRARLRETLKEMAQDWIEDPSNDNAAFERVRLRRALPALAVVGLDTAALARASRLMARIDDLMLDQADEAHLCRWRPEGAAVLDARALGRVPAHIARRFLSRLLRAIGGDAYPPRGAALEGLVAKLADPEARGATLAGCRLKRIDPASWFVMRELRGAQRAVPAALTGGETILWDNRFWVRLPPNRNTSFTVQSLGAAPNLPAELAEGRACQPAGEAMPGAMARLPRQTLPGLWQGGQLVEIPRIEPGWDGFARTPDRPAALFVGRERIGGGLCALWREMTDSAPQKETVNAQGSRNPLR